MTPSSSLHDCIEKEKKSNTAYERKFYTIYFLIVIMQKVY